MGRVWYLELDVSFHMMVNIDIFSDLEENNLDFLKINLDENLDKNEDENLDKNEGNLENLDKDKGNLKRKDNNIVFLENNLDENLDKNQVIHEIAPTEIELSNNNEENTIRTKQKEGQISRFFGKIYEKRVPNQRRGNL